MKHEFIQLRFEGTRFDEHTLPLEVAKDLAAYEVLVVELAKHLYIRDHPQRQRVPKGFAREFHLHLERVDSGSASPLLSVVAAGVLALGEGAEVYFERARDLISASVAAPEGQLPEEFPRELLSNFNRVGRSLREGEQMELPIAGKSPAILTPDRRKKLVLAGDKVYERETELRGTVAEADWEKSIFRLRLEDGSSVTVPMPDSFHDEVRRCGGRDRYLVTAAVVATFDAWDKLQKVVAVDSLDVQPDYELAVRFDQLRSMRDGWYDGVGKAPVEDKIDSLAAMIVGHYPEDLPLPAIVPTPEGDLLFEWNAAGCPSIDLRLSDMHAAIHVLSPDETDIEQEFDLSQFGSWQKLLSFLGAHIDSDAS